MRHAHRLQPVSIAVSVYACKCSGGRMAAPALGRNAVDRRASASVTLTSVPVSASNLGNPCLSIELWHFGAAKRSQII